MPPRKARIGVVFDTNVVVEFYISVNPKSASRRILRHWRNQRRLQMVVSDETVEEYLKVLNRLSVAPQTIKSLAERIEKRITVTKVSLGKRPTESRDADDNLMLATAHVGKAEFLVTSDNDLLDISDTDKKKFKFRIVSPAEFLKAIGE
ncbi:MAG: putative toxin-antitoxin system toxin component, PIN family [Pyrinomonadaceae bacterium]